MFLAALIWFAYATRSWAADYRLSLGHDGLTLGSNLLPWTAMSFVRETHLAFVFVIRAGSGIALPFRILTASEREAVRRLILEKVWRLDSEAASAAARSPSWSSWSSSPPRAHLQLARAAASAASN